MWQTANQLAFVPSSSALYFNLLGLWLIAVCAVFCGLIMYVNFKDCDPWTSGAISAPDQVRTFVDFTAECTEYIG